MTTCSRLSKTWRPALQSLIRRPPNNNLQRPGLERSRSRNFLSVYAWKRQVCDIAASLQFVPKVYHDCANLWLEGYSACVNHDSWTQSVSLATAGHS
jgi:hypothetical protein